MTLFTGKGDNGTTKILSSNERISKSSQMAEALGSLDEINSYLGLCKVQAGYLGFGLDGDPLSQIVHEMQKNLFIIQAELAGADKTIEERKVKEMEEVINKIEKKLPPIKSFFIGGGGEGMDRDKLAGAGLGSLFDIARTIARRAERRVVASLEEQTASLFDSADQNGGLLNKGEIKKGISQYSRSYLNRLSSLLYALARYTNHLSLIEEEAPDYR